MERSIRKYEEKDLERLLAVWESASRLAHPFLTDDFIRQGREDIPEVYMPIAETWVIEEEGTMFGFIALIGNEVGALFVQPEFIGTGGGKALMDKAVQLRGSLEVEVFKANSIGRKFYDTYGFFLLRETIHKETGQEVLRMGFTPKHGKTNHA